MNKLSASTIYRSLSVSSSFRQILFSKFSVALILGRFIAGSSTISVSNLVSLVWLKLRGVSRGGFFNFLLELLLVEMLKLLVFTKNCYYLLVKLSLAGFS